MFGIVSFDQLKSIIPSEYTAMPKKSPKNIGTRSLKVKPKKRPGLIKQLSQPFFPTKKNKNSNSTEPVTLISAHSKDELGLFSGFDDMFLPDSNIKTDSVFMSPEKEIETFMKFDETLLTVTIPEREKCSSADSGYMSPPPRSDCVSPSTLTPGKGILKKMRSVSPEIRTVSPVPLTVSPEGNANHSPPEHNGINDYRPLSPFERAMSPLGLDLQNALGILDDVLEFENDSKVKKSVIKSVSFGELAEVKNYFSDSSDNDICDDFKPMLRSVSLSDVECIKQDKETKNEINKSKKSVSFDDISHTSDIGSHRQEVGFIDIISEESDSSGSDIEKSDPEMASESCGCDNVCQYEVEVKVIDIQPVKKEGTENGQGHVSHDSDTPEMDYTCTELQKFNILICHHPGCTQNNENRPMLLCKECDNNIHQRGEYSGHLVLDVPKRKSNHGNMKFIHTNSTPTLHNNNISMDIAEMERDVENGDDQVAMETDNKNISKESPEMGEVAMRLKRKKVMKAKRRHTTGMRSHSASDIFTGNSLNSDDEEETKDRYSYHGSIDENTLMSTPSKAFHRHGKGTINHETFTVKIGLPGSSADEEVEIVAAEKNVTLREAIQPILERRGFDIDNINIFVEASNTPLPLNCETFLLGGTTMYIKQKDGETTLPPGSSQSLSKATGAKFTSGSKGQNSKSSKSGMSRRESMINRAQSMLEAPISKQRRSSLQLPFQSFFPSPKLGDGPRSQDEVSGSLRSRRGINLSIDDSSFPMSLTTSISPQGTLRDTESRKQKQSSKLTTLFSPMSKDKEKQEQLNELLSNYSTQGLPSPPSLMQIGHHPLDDAVLEIEADWRTIVDSSHNLTKRQQDQQEAIWELLQTELYYIRSLRVISDVFYCVLLNLQNELILNEIEKEKLFNNVSDIVTANTEFWSDHLAKVLQESRDTARPLNPSTMKEGFQRYHDIFHPYIQYCVKQKTCTDYMKSQYQDNELFKTFVVWAEAQKQCNRLKLTDLLVKPMQRLTKYSLLLQAILGKTDEEHQRRDLLEMIASVDHFVHHVNATLRQQYEEEKLQAIVDKIEPYDAVEAPNDECLKLIQQYNTNFNLITPMPGCDSSQTRALVMQSPLKMKEYQNRMDVECLLFTDLMLVCKASKRMDKYKIVKPPMRVDRMIVHELKDRGSFLIIYVNEYHTPVSSFTFHADQNAIQVWLTHIRKAQDLYRQARLATSDKLTFAPMEEVIEYTPLLIPENPPLLQLTRCASEEPNDLSGQSSPINRSKSWNEMVNVGKEPMGGDQVPRSGDSQLRNSASCSEPQLEHATDNSSGFVKPHPSVQYSRSDPTVFSKFIGDDRLQIPNMSAVPGDMVSGSEASLPEFVDDNMKSKLYQRRQSRTEKRYYTADAIQEMNKSQNRDNSIYKRLSWNFPNGDAGGERQGVLKNKTMSSDSIRSIHSSSGVSSTCSLHLSPDGDICEETDDMFDRDIEINNKFAINQFDDINEDDIGDIYDQEGGKSKSTPDIVSLMRDMNTGQELKDGIKSVDLPLAGEQSQKLSHHQLMRMKKQLLLSSNIEASEV